MWHGQKKLRDQVIVITGASSGIGLATARLAAERGAAVVLVSRDEEALARIADELRSAGGRATHVSVDVADPSSVERIAEVAVRDFGGFDTWVNDAGVSSTGALMDVPLDEQRRVFDVSFWGIVYGSRVAVRHFRERGGGTLINVGSIVSDHAMPLLGVYSATKHAVKGFTDALRVELEEASEPVAVTLIKPASIHTPFAAHSRSHTGREPDLPSPLYDPRVVARAILACAERPRAEVTVGGTGQAFVWAGRVAPRFLDRVARWLGPSGQQKDEPPRRDDALFTPGAFGGHERGPDARFVMRASPLTAARLHPWRALGLGALLALGIGALVARRAR
jgi:short-subunit dehydrogenase